MRALALSRRSQRAFVAMGIAASVVTISVLHYHASMHAILLHEILKRLYYVPIVVAAIHYGAEGGLATSLFSTALYLPHIVISWSRWPMFEVGQYGEIVLFNVVGAVTGVMADRLRAERNRYRQSSEDLAVAYRRVEATTNERINAEQMALVGRIAASVAHEIRTPLAAILGCFEILSGDYPSNHPKMQFINILKKEIARAKSVVTTFLDLTDSAPRQRRLVDVNQVVRDAAKRYEQPGEGNGHGGAHGLSLRLSASPILVDVDSDQVERALVELLIAGFGFAPHGSLTLSRASTADTGQIRLGVAGVTHHIPEDLFETFDDRHSAHAVMLPLVRRLLEKQGVTVQATTHESGLDAVIHLPVSRTAAAAAVAAASAGAS